MLGTRQATREAPPAVAELGPSAPDDGGVLEPLLPPELVWLYAVVPLPAAYLLRQGALEFQASGLAFVLVKAYLPFGVFGGSFQLVYRYVMPGLLRRMHASLRWVAHLGVAIAVVLAASALLLPLIGLLAGHRPRAGVFISNSLIFSALCLFPSLALQQQRLRARRAEERAQREREAALEAQLQALQARTDPHFLFNSLNTIASLIHDNPRLAERSLERLAELFRYTLAASTARTVKLERELAMVSDYLELQARPQRAVVPAIEGGVLLSAPGSRLFYCTQDGAIVAVPVPNSPGAPLGKPRSYRSGWAGHVVCGVGGRGRRVVCS